jgi:hypothetical protein
VPPGVAQVGIRVGIRHWAIEDGSLLTSVYLVIALGSSSQKDMDLVPAYIECLPSILGRATRWLGPTQEVARVLQTSFGFGTDASYKLSGWGNVGDQVHPLPGPDHRPVEISVPDGSSEPWDFLIQCCAEVIFPSLPAFHKVIAYGATGVRLRPRMLAYNIEDSRSLCIATLSDQNALLGAFVT